MSILNRDKHMICIKCRVYVCCVKLRCKECESWTEEGMIACRKMRKKLASIAIKKSYPFLNKLSFHPPQSSADTVLNARLRRNIHIYHQILTMILVNYPIALLIRGLFIQKQFPLNLRNKSRS